MVVLFVYNESATPGAYPYLYTLSLHNALPIYLPHAWGYVRSAAGRCSCDRPSVCRRVQRERRAWRDGARGDGVGRLGGKRRRTVSLRSSPENVPKAVAC